MCRSCWESTNHIGLFTSLSAWVVEGGIVVWSEKSATADRERHQREDKKCTDTSECKESRYIMTKDTLEMLAHAFKLQADA